MFLLQSRVIEVILALKDRSVIIMIVVESCVPLTIVHLLSYNSCLGDWCLLRPLGLTFTKEWVIL